MIMDILTKVDQNNATLAKNRGDTWLVFECRSAKKGLKTRPV